MEKLRGLLERPLIIGVIGFALGLIIGLPILGWGLFPVQWTDASVQHLRRDLQEDYLRMTIENFGKNKNEQLALQRWNELGDIAPEVLAEVRLDPSLKPEVVAKFSSLVLGKPVEEVEPDEAEKTTEEEKTAEAVKSTETVKPVATLFPPLVEQPKRGINPLMILGILCLGTLLVGATLFFVLTVRKPGRGRSVFGDARYAPEKSRQVPMTADDSGEQDQPVAQFMTTYTLGDDLYDDSFSIDSQSGEFLGECGVGISETIGVGDPKKVTAFEVWLFDKNDIQTVTKVLMSDYAFNDPGISQRLRSKGEPLVLEPGMQLLLETATLQLEVRVIDMNYGQSALPPASFVDRLTLELTVWPKAGG
ncbi:MAG: hypothetical protein U1B80_03345 [Anaerolineaceae bacterium]|nr:hypothetical protein [Anaerolineaceae bacterium]